MYNSALNHEFSCVGIHLSTFENQFNVVNFSHPVQTERKYKKKTMRTTRNSWQNGWDANNHEQFSTYKLFPIIKVTVQNSTPCHSGQNEY